MQLTASLPPIRGRSEGGKVRWGRAERNNEAFRDCPTTFNWSRTHHSEDNEDETGKDSRRSASGRREREERAEWGRMFQVDSGCNVRLRHNPSRWSIGRQEREERDERGGVRFVLDRGPGPLMRRRGRRPGCPGLRGCCAVHQASFAPAPSACLIRRRSTPHGTPCGSQPSAARQRAYSPPALLGLPASPPHDSHRRRSWSRPWWRTCRAECP